MLLRIASKELREISRDLHTVCVLVIFISILSWSCIAYSVDWSQQFALQSALQNQAREAWLTQETDSPHEATHQGTTVYKLPSPLASFDQGVAPELGSAVKIESHRRYEANHSANEDQVSLLQLDMTNPALLMQAVLPLVVILLSHTMVSRERELGTWRLLASFGVSHQRLVLGKLVALFLLTILLTAPVLVALLWCVVRSPAEMDVSLEEISSRGAAVYAVNLLYLAGWCAAGTALSARFSSGVTLIVLLTCWAGWTLVIPRLAVDLAYSRYPLPSEQSLLEIREAAIRQGSDGQVSLDEFNAELEKQLLRDYAVTDLEDLPVDLNVARLLAMEEFTDAIDDNIQQQLDEIYQQQNRFLDSFEFVSPYLAMRSASSSFAGTDRHHHKAFVASTETYRRLLVKTMNTAEMKGERPGATPQSAYDFWSSVPEFRPGFPPMAKVVYAMRWPIGLLTLWFALMLVFAMIPARRTVA